MASINARGVPMNLRRRFRGSLGTASGFSTQAHTRNKDSIENTATEKSSNAEKKPQNS